MNSFTKYVATITCGAMCSFSALATDKFPIPEGFKSGFEEVNGIKMHYGAAAGL